MTLYEKQIDLDHEKKLMEAIERKFDFTLVKLPMKYNLDALAFKAGNAKCFFEFKKRSHISKRYPTAFVSLEKVMAANRISKTTGLTCWLCVKWLDKVGVVKFDSHFEIGMGGRYDRNDPNDINIMAHYPIKGFTMLSLDLN